MFEQVWTIARNTFTESIRQPVYLVLVLLVVLMQIVAVLVSAMTLEDDNKLMIDMCLGSMFFLGGLPLAAFTAAGVVSREIDNKTVLTVISKPIGRPAFVAGKFLGVAGAIGLAFWVWSMVFLLCVRHGVMWAAYIRADWPVILFGVGAGLIALVAALWGNYFYGWVFTSRFTGLLAAALTVACLLVLMIDKEWRFQPITAEFAREEGRLGQVLIALLLVFEGLVVISAVAVACSTRLGVVMTLVICAAVWFVGMASDYFFGQFTDSQPLAWLPYALAPNMQFLWLADALTQQHDVSARYVLMVSGYSVLYMLAVLCLATALFQTRETG